MEANITTGKNLFAKGYEIFTYKFLSFILFSFLYFTPVNIGYLIAKNYFQNKDEYIYILGANTEILKSSVILLILQKLVTPFFISSIFFITTNYITNTKEKIGNTVIRVFKKSFTFLIAATFFYGGILLLSPLFIFIPYFISCFYFTFYLIADNFSLKDSVKKSIEMNKNNWIISFMFILGIYTLDFLCSVLFTNLYHLSKLPYNNISTMLIINLSNSFRAYFYIVTSLWYINKKINGGSGFNDYI